MSASTTSSEVPGRKLIPWICLALLVACRRSPQPVLAFVAVSAAAAIERAAKSLEVPLVVDANASSLLAQQIVRGAKPEIFVSANAEWMDFLEKQGKLEAGSRRVLFRNAIVLVAKRDPGGDPQGTTRPTTGTRPLDLKEPLALTGRIAIGDPEHVPLGQYTKRALLALQRWTGVQDDLMPCPDARAVVVAVETGAAAYGFVYRSDALRSRRLRIVAEIPHEADPQVAYEIAIVQGASARARDVLTAFASAEARASFRDSGFDVER